MTQGSSHPKPYGVVWNCQKRHEILDDLIVNALGIQLPYQLIETLGDIIPLS